MKRFPHYQSYERGPVEFKSRIHKKEGEIMTIARKPLVTVTPSTPIKECMRLMVSNSVRRLLIMRPGTMKLEGVVRSRDFVNLFGGGEKYKLVEGKFRGNFYAVINEPVKSIMETKFPTGDIYMSIQDAVKTLLQTGVGGLPVLNDDGDVVGVVSERDLISLIPATTGRTAGYYMTRHVITVEPETPIGEAARRMTSFRVRRVPVVRERDLVGIITTVDIMKYFGSSKVFEFMKSQRMDEALSVPTQEIMTREVLKATPEMDAGEVAALMREKGCGGLPVLSDGALAGIITEHDLLRLLA
ncbi:MAG: CBS domain-containing protein [Candidatus Hadarchaeales archaeon]